MGDHGLQTGSFLPLVRRILQYGSIEVSSGKQVMYMAGHNDWVRDTVFSMDGKSVFSVSRDKTVKTNRHCDGASFVGNVTTHTPFVLSGGQSSIDVHPKKTELLCWWGGWTGQAFSSVRQGGSCRWWGIRIKFVLSKLLLAGSLRCASATMDLLALPEVAWMVRERSRPFKLIMERTYGKYRCPRLECTLLLVLQMAKPWRFLDLTEKFVCFPPSRVKSVRFFIPVEIEESSESSFVQTHEAKLDDEPKLTVVESLAEEFIVQSLYSFPPKIKVSRVLDYGQIILVAKLQGGSEADITRMSKWKVEGGGRSSISARTLYAFQKWFG